MTQHFMSRKRITQIKILATVIKGGIPLKFQKNPPRMGPIALLSRTLTCRTNKNQLSLTNLHKPAKMLRIIQKYSNIKIKTRIMLSPAL